MPRLGPDDLSRLDSDINALSPYELEELAAASSAALSSGHAATVAVPRMERLLKALVRARRFATSARLAHNLRSAGITSGLLTKLAVQALIDSGQLVQAESLQRRAVAELGADEPEHLELVGLGGRIGKQRYVDQFLRSGSAPPEDLRTAIDSYLTAYEQHAERPIWHGINAVALLARARRDGVDHPAIARLGALTRAIADRAPARQHVSSAGYWDLATAAEAALAREEIDSSELWLRRALESTDIAPFGVASTLRQLREVWGLGSEHPPGSLLLPPLEKRMAEYGAMTLPPGGQHAFPDRHGYEKIFGDATFMSFARYRTGIDRAAAVCRVENRFNEPQGTGFLIGGRVLSPHLPDEPVLVTNAHVIGDREQAAVALEDARFVFYGVQAAGGAPSYPSIRGRRVIWTSPSADPARPDALDVTIIEPAEKQPVTTLDSTARNRPAARGEGKVIIVGHPGGGGLSFALTNNDVLDYDPDGPRIHYRAPTEGGSSGSPVFNEDWELVAVHHSGRSDMPTIDGRTRYEANEGVWIEFVRQAIGTSLRDSFLGG